MGTTTTAACVPGHNKTSKKYHNAASPSIRGSHCLPYHSSSDGGGGGGRGAWLLWAFYAKFAEICLKDPRLAFYALDRAVDAASAEPLLSGRTRRTGANRSSGGGGGVGGRGLNSGGALALVARAQFCQRWPKLSEGDSNSFSGSLCGRDASTPEQILRDATMR